MRTPRPAAGAAHATSHFGEAFLYADVSGFFFFAGGDPADPFVAGERGYVLPQGEYLGRSSDSLAQVVWLVCAIAALFLAVGALLIALGDSVNRSNDLVQFVLDTADKLDLGVFDLDDGVFSFHGKNAETKDALLNWGLAAVSWLIAGRILDRIIRP